MKKLYVPFLLPRKKLFRHFFAQGEIVKKCQNYFGVRLWLGEMRYRKAKILIFSVLSKGGSKEGTEQLVITAVLKEHLQR